MPVKKKKGNGVIKSNIKSSTNKISLPDDRYQFVKLIGCGQFGDVWIVEQKDQTSRQRRILKRFKLDSDASEPLETIRIFSSLEHRNMITFFEKYYSSDGYLNVILEFCENGNLLSKIEKQRDKGFFLEAQILVWFKQIALGIKYLHVRHIIHRDLKPQKILFTGNDIVKVGFSAICCQLKDNGTQLETTMIGTPYYMSPEIIQSQPYGIKTDIWALGCCLYEMATFTHPFNGNDMRELIENIIRGTMTNLPEAGKYTDSMKELIKSMLMKDPAQRPTIQQILQLSYVTNVHVPKLSEQIETSVMKRPTTASTISSEIDYADMKPLQLHRYSDMVEEPNNMLLPIEGYEKKPLVTLEEAIIPLIPLVPDIERKAWIAKLRCSNPANELTPDESASIMLYTIEWSEYTDSLYYILNSTFRKEQRSLLKPWLLYLKLILTGLSKLPSISGRTIYRGVKLDLSDNYSNGKTFVWWGFSSCTATIDVLDNEQILGKSGTRTLFTIECMKAKDIRLHSVYSNENELLLLPATQLQVVARYRPSPDVLMIQLKEIEPRFPLLEPITNT